ncbi:hypothetical protein BDA96_01G566300 [Sorghum bicolor]|jgi:hypothetical protein|uniref:Uncharacterized protein n=2 Tax=Sorghum bicolor TaxID=4558 RepID=A0A921V4G2_SORBI|nr:hypothetical protein BDA96_01G566300 [Sorghum bicolor]OQU93374.1 hypothetical protein SORBI_3001G530201 [Sorghum bicolor]
MPPPVVHVEQGTRGLILLESSFQSASSRPFPPRHSIFLSSKTKCQEFACQQLRLVPLARSGKDQFCFHEKNVDKDSCSLASSPMTSSLANSEICPPIYFIYSFPSAQSTHGLSTAGSTDQELLRLIGVAFSGQQ